MVARTCYTSPAISEPGKLHARPFAQAALKHREVPVVERHRFHCDQYLAGSRDRSGHEAASAATASTCSRASRF